MRRAFSAAPRIAAPRAPIPRTSSGVRPVDRRSIPEHRYDRRCHFSPASPRARTTPFPPSPSLGGDDPGDPGAVAENEIDRVGRGGSELARCLPTGYGRGKAAAHPPSKPSSPRRTRPEGERVPRRAGRNECRARSLGAAGLFHPPPHLTTAPCPFTPALALLPPGGNGGCVLPRFSRRGRHAAPGHERRSHPKCSTRAPSNRHTPRRILLTQSPTTFLHVPDVLARVSGVRARARSRSWRA